MCKADFCCAEFMRSYWGLTILENGTTCLFVFGKIIVSVKCSDSNCHSDCIDLIQGKPLGNICQYL